MNIKYATFAIISLCCLALLALYYKIKNLEEKKLYKTHVVCTTTILGDTIKQIAGNSIHLDILMGPGVDPHTYKPIEPDMIKIAQADVIMYHGLHLEARMADLFKHLSYSKTTLAASECIPKEKLICADEQCNIYDPHVWLHPLLWIKVVEQIAKTLSEIIPDEKTAYEHNANVFIQKIQQIYQTTLEQTKQINPKKRVLITSHDAFSYFAQAYDFTTMSLQGINTATQTGLADTKKIVNFIVQYKIPTIFIESSIPPKTMQAIQEQVQSLGSNITISDELYSDSLSPNTGPAATYLDMIKYNLQTIIHGLQ